MGLGPTYQAWDTHTPLYGATWGAGRHPLLLCSPQGDFPKMRWGWHDYQGRPLTHPTALTFPS
jgi:hypothetical protein